MHNYYKHIILLGKRLILIMILMTITRILFYIFNYSIFNALTLSQVLLHFVYGIRFDLAIVFIFNIFFILFSVLPDVVLNIRGYQKFLKIYFIINNGFLIALNLIDVKFYEFEGKRLTSDIFSKEWLGNDLLTLIPEFLKGYWYLFLLFFVFIYFFWRLYPNYKRIDVTHKKAKKIKYLSQAGLGILLLIISLVAGRGGVQLKPIGIIAAARYTSPEFMALILNSPFTLAKTYGDKSLPNPKYYTSGQLDEIYNPIHKFNHKKPFRDKNVVIIILESFGREYSGFLNDTIGFTPNLDSIMRMSLTFKNAFANGKRSIEAMPSIYSALPALMDNALVNTKFSSNSVEGIGTILHNKGYISAFYHGGKNGTMGFDNYARLVGIDSYFGKDEYPNEGDYDGNWGIFDEPYLQYFANQLNNMQEPFFASVFTLSSHHPYKIPKKYKNRFPKGNLVNIESIGYADYALGEFFKTASTQPWFSNTLFVLTADHTAQAKHSYYKSNIGKYAVPIVFYAPGDSLMLGISNRVCQQTDIMPSILDYLRYNEPFVAFGNSIFSSENNGIAVSYLSGIYQLINNDVAITFNGNEIINSIFFNSDSSQTEQYIGDSLLVFNAEKKLKGIIQQYNTRMEKNLLICR